MLKMFTLTLCFVAIVGVGFSAPSSAQVKCAATVSGDLRIESLDSGTYGEKRKIRIWLPPGYDAAENTQHRYPVLYMFDGQTLFDTCTAFSGEGEWEIDETLTRLIAETKIPPMIVVGMDSNSRRGYEYQPWKDVVAEPAALEPIGKVLPAFVVNDVMTYLRRCGGSRPIQPGRVSRGSIAQRDRRPLRPAEPPDRFGLGLIESPTLPLGNGQMLRDTAFLARGPNRVSIGVGTTRLRRSPAVKEVKFAAQVRMPLTTANAGFARMAETLAENLRAAYLNHPDVTLVVEPNANHTVGSWARRFSRAVTILFGEPLS